MKNQIFVAIGLAIVASVLVIGVASTMYAQSDMTGDLAGGGNMTSANMTGGNMTSATGATGDDNGEDEDEDGEDEDDDEEGSN